MAARERGVGNEGAKTVPRRRVGPFAAMAARSKDAVTD